MPEAVFGRPEQEPDRKHAMAHAAATGPIFRHKRVRRGADRLAVISCPDAAFGRSRKRRSRTAPAGPWNGKSSQPNKTSREVTMTDPHAEAPQDERLHCRPAVAPDPDQGDRHRRADGGRRPRPRAGALRPGRSAEHRHQPAARFQPPRRADDLFLRSGRPRDRPVLQQLRPAQRRYPAALDRRALGGRAGLERAGALPRLERHPQQPANALDRG